MKGMIRGKLFGIKPRETYCESSRIHFHFLRRSSNSTIILICFFNKEIPKRFFITRKLIKKSLKVNDRK